MFGGYLCLKEIATIVFNNFIFYPKSISPGAVRTEIMGPETPELQAMLKDFPILQSDDISAAVLYVLGTPPHVQVHELIIKPLGEAF